MLMDDDDDMLLRYIDEQNIYEGLTILQRRESVPNVAGYMDVINEMRIPENIDDFQYHYRVSRHLFDIILGELYGTLVRNGKGRYETVTPEKQLLVGLSYLSNMQSMREVAHVFSLSKSTVHNIVLAVNDALCKIGDRVSV